MTSTLATPPQADLSARGVAAPQGKTLAAQRKAAEEFEAQMLGALLQPMFQGLKTDGPFGGGAAEEQWRPMMVEQFGRAMAHAGGVGIGTAVLAEMQRLQAQANTPGGGE